MLSIFTTIYLMVKENFPLMKITTLLEMIDFFKLEIPNNHRDRTMTPQLLSF